MLTRPFHARLRPLVWVRFVWWVLFSAGVAAQSNSPNLPTLTHAEEVRRLTPEEAAKGYPVRLRGVVTMDAPAPDFFVQDKTAGIYVEGSASPQYPHVLSEVVEIDGVTGPGKFAPVIREQKTRVVAQGSLPQARIFPFAEISDGQQDSQWVRLRGIVRAASIDRASWREMTLALRVASAGGDFDVRVPISHEQDFSSWIDNEVVIEGVCGSLYNVNRQLTGILLYVPRLSFIKVEASAREVPLSSLLRFSAGEIPRHRVRIRGVVAYQQFGNALFLQGEGKGLRVLTQQATAVAAGDVVDVLGFPAVGESAPILEDAVFHRVGSEEAPKAKVLNIDQPWEQFDGALVTTDARLLNRSEIPNGLRLLLQRGELIFDATLPGGSGLGTTRSIPVNSEIRLTGICLVRSGGLWHTPQSFRMLLRSEEDVVVLRTPSWWNLRHTLWLLGITAGILLIAVIWTLVLSRRIREQMEVIRQKLRTSAVLEERNRIARELHDTLEQELAGITLQLDLAVDSFSGAPRIAEQAVETARNMSRHSMIEARRSVWDLRCHLLETGDLVSALRQIVLPLAPRDGQIEVRIEGEQVRLASTMEMNLLRIGQEAAGNAVKHGGARNIRVELRYTPATVRLTVTDDGKGFDAAQPSRTGHFGVQDMRERAQSMGSELQIVSEPSQGTSVSVEVHIDPGKILDTEHKADTYSRR